MGKGKAKEKGKAKGGEGGGVEWGREKGEGKGERGGGKLEGGEGWERKKRGDSWCSQLITYSPFTERLLQANEPRMNFVSSGVTCASRFCNSATVRTLRCRGRAAFPQLVTVSSAGDLHTLCWCQPCFFRLKERETPAGVAWGKILELGRTHNSVHRPHPSPPLLSSPPPALAPGHVVSKLLAFALLTVKSFS